MPRKHPTFHSGSGPGQVHVIGATGTSHASRSVAPLVHDDGTFRSPYEPFANQGPTITDRRLFFVTAHTNEGPYALPDTFITHPRIGTLDKKTYSVSELDGHLVSGDNLFSVYLGESVAPYVTLPPLSAVLPVSKATMEMPLDHSGCKKMPSGFVQHNACEVDTQELDDRIRSRWDLMERLWEANRGKADTKSLTQNLNWLNKLTSQLEYLRSPGKRPVRIAYTQSGRPTASLIVDDSAILDRKLYQVTCRSKSEAYYLLATINSLSVEREVGNFMPKGLFRSTGPRKAPVEAAHPGVRGQERAARQAVPAGAQGGKGVPGSAGQAGGAQRRGVADGGAGALGPPQRLAGVQRYGAGHRGSGGRAPIAAGDPSLPRDRQGLLVLVSSS